MPFYKIKTHCYHDKGKIFAWMALFSNAGFAAFITVLVPVLSEKIKNDVMIGSYFAVIAIVALITSLSSTIILKKFSKVTITKITLSIGCATFFLFTLAAAVWQFVIFDIVRAISMTLFLIVMAIFVRDFSKQNQLALSEGRYYFFGNIGWIIGPVTGGLLAKFINSESAFIFAGIMYLVTLFLFLHEHYLIKNPHLHEGKNQITMKEFWGNVRLFFSHKKLLGSFMIAFGLYYWFTIYKIYVPLTITNLGYTKDVVGIVISAAMLPLVLFEIPISQVAQKYGVKRYLFFGYLWLCITLFSFVYSTIPLVTLIMMVVINFGAALIEPLHETYFFQLVDKKEEDRLYGIYHISYSSANILTPLFGSLILYFGNFNSLWIFSSMVFFVMAWLTLGIKKRSS